MEEEEAARESAYTVIVSYIMNATKPKSKTLPMSRVYYQGMFDITRVYGKISDTLVSHLYVKQAAWKYGWWGRNCQGKA